MGYSKIDIERVRSAADIRDFVPDLSGRGASLYTECPACGKKGKNKGLIVTHKGDKDIARCFSCGFTLNGAINAALYYEFGNDQSKFAEALEFVARRSGIIIESDEERKKRQEARQTSFCERQLAASGLTIDDVTAKVTIPGKGEMLVPTFRKGGVDAYWNVNESDDEMLIYYFDLEGKPYRYATKGAAGAQKDYVRVRWSNPSAHRSAEGKEIKYQTPKGATLQIFIPQQVRELYQRGEHIETLVIQEGEKKAVKACKHGVISVAIQGIFNIGNKQDGLIKDIQYLVQRCTIRNIILLMDADYNDLSKSVEPGESVDNRPRQFAKAVIKYKEQIYTLHAIGANVDIFWGHIKPNERGDKGCDDLLVGTLKGREELLEEDIRGAMMTHDGHGNFVNVYNISTMSQMKIYDFWGLNEPSQFFEMHKELLLKLGRFKFNRFAYQVKDGQFIQDSAYASENDMWTVKYGKDGEAKYEFDVLEALAFLQGNKFFRIRTASDAGGSYSFCHIEDGVVQRVVASDIRDYVYSYINYNCKIRDVKLMLAKSLTFLLGDGQLERLKMISDEFNTVEPFKQRFNFSNGEVIVQPDRVDFSEIRDPVWVENIVPRKFKRIKLFKEFRKDEDTFEIALTEEGKKCEFLRFLMNVSNFWGRVAPEKLSEENEKEYRVHIANKITAMGYLLNSYKFATELRAVVAMDGKLVEYGEARGRTGKSLLGEALSYFVERVNIDGKQLSNDDQYIYSEVNSKTRLIHVDDVQPKFDFTRFYVAITGDLAVNPKGKGRFTIKRDVSPKLYITTNYAISNLDRSTQERIVFIEFSDWYNDEHKVLDDFGHRLFDEWDEEQWQLFDNLMVECNMIYQRSMAEGWQGVGLGAVQPPIHDITRRNLYQAMGVVFVEWAQLYLDPEGTRMDVRLSRKELYQNYLSEFPGAKHTLTPAAFKQRLVYYCKYKQINLNVHKQNKEGMAFSTWREYHPNEVFIGGADKSNGEEYFTFSPSNKSDNEMF